MSTVDPKFEASEIPTEGGLLDAHRRQKLSEVYRSALLDDIVPWWQEHSVDTEQGGYFSRLNREGQPYSFDKDMWMTGRQVWMFAHLYNRHEQRPLWLEIARTGASFLLQHAFRPDGGMYFRTNREGKPLASILSVYTKVFAAIGLLEYAKAANDGQAYDRALSLYGDLEFELRRLSDTPLLGYPLKHEFDLHSRYICLMTVAWVFNECDPCDRYASACTAAMDHILNRFWKPEQNVLLENVGPQGEVLIDLPEGRTINPGHALESAWMMLEIAARDENQTAIDLCVDIILASLKGGWDEEQGGLFYIKNFDDTPCHCIESQCKLWWPHGEALYATMLGWSLTGKAELASWYNKIHHYTFSRFPDEECGEWYGYLNRDGSPIWTAKANGWKGCFHVPRILFRAFQLLSSNKSE
ncbi:AGE family epimerase/isomerase [Aeoliella sp. ICT_H6.2]|uniref:AGE family epimerase/isomerase n=1 Tax=Aeoliella straminimaris TaxID=2954799 RepID=A0A9X2JIT1_9BACT|nr:AGE family epimerase/isomerase [Aeoliella straminimaris]MCO6047156.1 AGE family epimerase/isomerase [Aeoliella straminimaris]